MVSRSLIERACRGGDGGATPRTRSSRWCRGCGSALRRRDCRTGSRVVGRRLPAGRAAAAVDALAFEGRPARDVRPWRRRRRPPRACSARRSPAGAARLWPTWAARSSPPRRPPAGRAARRRAARPDRGRAGGRRRRSRADRRLRQADRGRSARERPAVLLMRALAAAGHQAEACRVPANARPAGGQTSAWTPSRLDRIAVLRQPAIRRADPARGAGRPRRQWSAAGR